MKLSEALSPATWLEVQFAGGNVLRVLYRPSRATIAQLKTLSVGGTDEEKMDRIITQFMDIIQDWDLFEDDGETRIPLTRESLENVPTSILKEVLSGVMKHQNPGEAESSSRVG